jgi:hypothetical protein
MNGTTGHRDPQRHSRRRACVLAAAAVSVAVLAVACGSGGSSPAGSSLSHPPGYQRYHVYSQCMRSHGAPFWPEPSVVPQGVMGLVWQVVWWWPAGAPQPGPAGLGPARSVRQ